MDGYERLNSMLNRDPGAEAWLDALLPLAVVVVGLQRGGDPPALVFTLSLWLALKLILKAVVQPIFWVLLGVLLVCMASLLQQSTAVSSPTDLLVFLLALAVGFGRTRSQWRLTAWMVTCIAIAALTACHWVSHELNSNADLLPAWAALRQDLQRAVVRIGGIAINRSAYLLGFVVLSAWSLFRHERCHLLRCLALLCVAVAYGLAFLTGSRAGAGLPVLVILVVEVCWFGRRFLMQWSGKIAIFFMASLLACGVFLYHPSSPFAYGNVSDSGRAEVAHCFLRHSSSDPVTLLMGHGGDVTGAACRLETRNPRFVAEGLRHAHNTFLQILADQGLVCVVALLGLVFLGLRSALLVIAAGDGLQGFLALSFWLFFMGFGMLESTLLHVSLLQVCSGYLLASAWPRWATGRTAAAAATGSSPVGWWPRGTAAKSV